MSATYATRLGSVLAATISSGGTVSTTIDMSRYVLAAIVMPSAWTTAAITFLAAARKGDTFVPVYDDAGTEVTIPSTVALPDRIIVNKAVLEQLAGLTYLRLRSGTNASPVSQAADRTIYLLVKS